MSRSELFVFDSRCCYCQVRFCPGDRYFYLGSRTFGNDPNWIAQEFCCNSCAYLHRESIDLNNYLLKESEKDDGSTW